MANPLLPDSFRIYRGLKVIDVSVPTTMQELALMWVKLWTDGYRPLEGGRLICQNYTKEGHIALGTSLVARKGDATIRINLTQILDR